MPTVTMLYAGILGLIALGVAFPAGKLRGKMGVSIGDGGSLDLLLAMRRHANFAEWVPLALILLALLEFNQVKPGVIHALGATLVAARLAHAFGIKAHTIRSPARAIGAMLTALVVLVASIWAIVRFLS